MKHVSNDSRYAGTSSNRFTPDDEAEIMVATARRSLRRSANTVPSPTKLRRDARLHSAPPPQIKSAKN
jgi:hypothetical protein